jgi:hypothetical protein
MHLPDPLYRALPYLCVIMGMLIALLLSHPIAIFSAALLIMAGLQIFDARITKRVRRHELGHYRRCEMAHTCDNRVD